MKGLLELDPSVWRLGTAATSRDSSFFLHIGKPNDVILILLGKPKGQTRAR